MILGKLCTHFLSMCKKYFQDLSWCNDGKFLMICMVGYRMSFV